MPYLIQKENDQYCVYTETDNGQAGEKVTCHASEDEAKVHMRALYASVEDAAKAFLETATVKAVGDWELDVTAIPFYKMDADKQWFDDQTDIMHDAFPTPLIVYQHGIKQGAKELDEKPVVLGKTVPGSLEKRSDGWHIRVVLDKTVKYAKQIMDAAKRGLVAVSSGSIAHLARLDVNGRLMQYEKNRPGRIAVWALGEVSLWERGNGNMQPANPFAVALPVMKAMYRDAGIPFPEIKTDTGGDAQANSKHRARVNEVKKKSLEILKRINNSG